MTSMLTITTEHEYDAEHQAWIEDIKQKIAVGIAELDRGEGIDGPTAMNYYLQQFQAAKQSV